jgi:hypothetical protein
MSSVVEQAVRTYIRAAEEPDAETRSALLEQCLAPDLRLVTRGNVLAGRAAVEKMIDRVYADPELKEIRLTSELDLGATTFRYTSVVEFKNGKVVEFFDAGEVGPDGKILLLLVFDGPLPRAG